jgi:thioredoxin 1
MDQMSKIDEITSDVFKSEVLKSDIPVVVDFWAPWCGPCRMVAPVLEEISQKMNGKIRFVKINTDENQKTAMDYQIMAIPSLLIFKDGQEVDRIVGFVTQDKLEADLNKVVS